MKVLLVNTSDHAGGAAIASLRLLKALRQAGIEATMLCRDRSAQTEGMDEVMQLKPTLWRKAKFLLERLEIYIANGFKRKGLFAVDTARFGNDITKLKAFREADVIHLHWTNQAMLSLGNLKKILNSGKRIVWTMHDMWPFTGVCHNSADCDRWFTSGCGRCPMLLRPATNDLSASTYRRKKAVYATGQITFVGCSRWMADKAAQAPLLSNQRVATIPNPIDTHFYAPAGTEGMPTQTEVRTTLNLPTDRLLILFSAFKVTDHNKGIDHLIEAVKLLQKQYPEWSERLGIVLAGRGANTLQEAFGDVPVYAMGYVEDEERMRQIYQACNLFAMPTLMDNLPNTVAESMACGVPCVAFSVGGVPQMIDHGVNGYLAKYDDCADLAKGIYATLNSPSYTALCRNARTKAVNAYDESTVAASYIKLYKGQFS